MTQKKQHKPDIESEETTIEPSEPTEITEEMEERSEWQVKAEEYLADLQRSQADFENYKKRQEESQRDLRGILIERLILDIVPVLDNFRSATQHVPLEQKESSWVIGIQYIEKQLEDVIKANGVEIIETKEGDTFDPTVHEAVGSGEAENNEPVELKNEGSKIVKVLQNGFKLGGKVIRPVKVIIQ